jgi:hypothetical protein
MNTEDYQPHGTDFRVEYHYCGFGLYLHCLQALAYLLPAFKIHYIFNPTFIPLNATVFGMRSSLPYHWLPLLLGSSHS